MTVEDITHKNISFQTFIMIRNISSVQIYTDNYKHTETIKCHCNISNDTRHKVAINFTKRFKITIMIKISIKIYSPFFSVFKDLVDVDFSPPLLVTSIS